MGGYGTLQHRHEVSGSVRRHLRHELRQCGLQPPNAEAVKTQLARMTPELQSKPRDSSNGMQSQASAWAPNPLKPPFFFDLPFDAEGKPVPLVADKWAANSLLVTVDQNVPALKSFQRRDAGRGQPGRAAGFQQRCSPMP